MGVHGLATPLKRMDGSTRHSGLARPNYSFSQEAPGKGLGTLSSIQKWNNNNRLQTQVLNIADDTVAIRCLDWDRARFDIEFALQEGTTYNSFLIFGEEKTALVDASHEKFRDLYMPKLRALLKERGRGLDYVFVSHTEPDHSGLVGDITSEYPDVTVVASKVALNFLGGLLNEEFRQQAVKGGDRIDLGGGHVMEFIMAPNLHWPDSMFTFDPATQIMYTCDAFGMHYCTTDVYDEELDALVPHYRFYYDCLMKPNSRSVLTALRKVKDLPYTVISPGHGPLLKNNMEQMVGMYRKWSSDIGKAPTAVAILYSAEYGYCDRLAQTLAKGLTKAGVVTEMLDLLSVDPAELRMSIGRSEGVALMCPPHSSRDARESLGIVFSELKPKQKVIIAESYGGDDEPVDTLLNSLVNMDLEVAAEPLRIKSEPDEQLYQQYEETGTDLAQALLSKETNNKRRSMPPELSKALGCLSSGLYVVTASRGGASSAMLASWVAQASFEPLGFSVAVANDRAIEALLQVGDEFVLNVLGDDNYNQVMRHFLQRFAPGADRFEGIETIPAQNGSPILKDAIAYLECKVESRMETADHWITFCSVTAGNVSRPSTKTAVHRRKTAVYY